MHTSDRTLLAKLGFSDPDKKDVRHDLACQYLASPENHERLISFIPSARICPPPRRKRPEFEAVVMKGTGEYRSMVGYLDLVLPFELTESASDGSTALFDGKLVVEVKIRPISVGDILRQIKLYRQFFGDSWTRTAWLLATAYRISRADRDSLLNERIHHIHLSDGFEAWVGRQEDESSDGLSPEF